jgi:hypothetical protein
MQSKVRNYGLVKDGILIEDNFNEFALKVPKYKKVNMAHLVCPLTE